MSSSPSALTDAASRALVLRHARTLIDKTQAFFAGPQGGQLKILRNYLFELIDARPHTTQAQNLRAAAGLLDKQEALYQRSLQAALREAIEDEIEAILPGSLKILRPADDSGGIWHDDHVITETFNVLRSNSPRVSSTQVKTIPKKDWAKFFHHDAHPSCPECVA